MCLDIYCYDCNISKLDPELALHLSAFGINIAAQTKTEVCHGASEAFQHAQPVVRLHAPCPQQINQNLKFDFSLTVEDGKALEPLFGPGLTGLTTLGNRYGTSAACTYIAHLPFVHSCYMASTLQTVFALPTFRVCYLSSFTDHARTCSEPLPVACVDCQMAKKVADGLHSGRYSIPRSHVPALTSASSSTLSSSTRRRRAPMSRASSVPWASSSARSGRRSAR